MGISKEAKSAYDKAYRLKNLEKRRAQQRAWNALPEKKAHKKAYDKVYRAENRLKNNARTLERKKTDINFKLAINLRSRLLMAVKKSSKRGSAVRDLGCSIEFLKKYLESKFQPGMNWENWSRTGWHIDHILPLSSFDLSNREQLLKAVHYTNLQPLWAVDNLTKNAKVA